MDITFPAPLNSLLISPFLTITSRILALYKSEIDSIFGIQNRPPSAVESIWLYLNADILESNEPQIKINR